jgi:magnesium-transporting ATPase (P-type)
VFLYQRYGILKRLVGMFEHNTVISVLKDDNKFSSKQLFESGRTENNQTIKITKRSVIRKILFLGMVLAITLGISAWLVPSQYLVYHQVIQVGVIGYLVVQITANTIFRIAVVTLHSARTAKSIRSITRISEAIVIAVVAVSYLG